MQDYGQGNVKLQQLTTRICTLSRIWYPFRVSRSAIGLHIIPQYQGSHNSKYRSINLTLPSKISEQQVVLKSPLVTLRGHSARIRSLSTRHGIAFGDRHGRSDEHSWCDDMRRRCALFFRWKLRSTKITVDINIP